MAEWRDFGATNEPDTCLWCGKELRYRYRDSCWTPWTEDTPSRRLKPAERRRAELGGDYEDGFFCGLRCAYMFARRLAQLGNRLVGK